MEMNSPVGSNALDVGADGIVGKPLDRVDGRLKVTRAAENAPGVVFVLTHRNAPDQGTGNHREAHPVLTGPEVTRYGEPVAFVVAESFEQARAAAYLVDVKYDRSGGKYTLRHNLDQARVPRPSDGQP